MTRMDDAACRQEAVCPLVVHEREKILAPAIACSHLQPLIAQRSAHAVLHGLHHGGVVDAINRHPLTPLELFTSTLAACGLVVRGLPRCNVQGRYTSLKIAENAPNQCSTDAELVVLRARAPHPSSDAMRSAFSAAKISKLHLDGQVPLSMMNKMELMPPDEEDEDHLELLDPEDFPAHQSLRYLDATGSGSEGSKGGTERKSRLSFPRGRAPPLPNGVRTRNLDVGARIGRRQNDPARPGTDGSETKKANAMEEQMRRIENRKEGDEKLNACRKALEQAKWERGLDSIPYLPGRWTEKLHSKVLGCLRECQDTLEKAERLYASAEAKDKVPESTDLKEQLRGAEQHAKNTKEAWLVLGDAEAMLQEAARKGWPHGQREFEQAVAMVHKARECFLEIGEAGAHDTGQVRPREKMLKKMSQRVLTVRKECERRRCKVQVLLNRLGHAKWETRFQAMLEMAEIGRQPVPCSVTFLGELVSTVDEKEWHENTGRGDSQVVDGILSMMKDTESEVRRVVVDSLPRVCQAGDPLVLEAISSLTADPVNKVKCNAMDALAHLSERGNQMVVKNLCAMLEDADTAVRNLGVRLLPLVTNKPADNFAIDEVLTRLDHKRRFDEHPHWITEERDVRLAALKTLTLIAPHGHDKVIRRLAMVLRNSWDILIRDFTGCARNADEPHKGSSSDYGFSRGPVSLRAQLKAIETEAACRCPAKCGEAAAAVRIAAIEVLVAVSIKRTDLAWQRKQLNEEYEDGNRSPLGMSRAPSQMSGGSGRDSGRSTPGSKTPGNKTPGNKTPGHKTPGKYTPYSFSRTASNSNKAEWLAQRAMLKTQQDKAFGDLVRYTTVVECLCERLCDMDREVRWTAARALVQHVADIDDTIVVEALAKSLEHSESEVRQLAIEMIKGSALGVIVSPGNEEMTDAICKRFVSSRPATRSAAALALMGHCNVGDHNAIYFLIPQLWHPDSHVRQDALVTLKKLVPKGNSDVLRNVEKGAFEPDPSLRIMAIYALSELADSDDNVTGALLEDMLFDQDDSVVCAATFAVANLAQRGDADALDVLLNNCEDMSEAVRRASIQALTRISNKGDVAVVEAALKLIDDPDSSVRNQALETLTNVADKGNTKVCAKIIARLGTQGGDGVRAIAELRDLRWSTSRSISFTFGSVGPPGTTHSGVFEWSQPPSLTVGEDFRMPGGVPVTDGAGVRSKTWGGNFVRNATVTNNKSGNWEGVEGASVTWGPTTRLPKTGQSLADYEGYPDAPVDTRPPTTSVINLPFAVRPTTAPTAGPPLVFRLGAELHAVSRPGTRQSTRLGTTSSVSTFARVLYSPLFLIDSDGGYDSIFGLVLLSLAGLVPQLVTTVHGMGEAVSSAVNIKRLYATLQSPQVPVVPSVDSALVRNKDGKLCLSRPGTSLVRLDGSTRRVPSRFGPDYRRHLAELGDHLFLTPLGVSYEKLLQPPGLTLRVANLERDLRLLAMVAGANVSDLEVELAALAQSLEALNQRGKDYYAEQGRGLSRDGRPPSGLVSLNRCFLRLCAFACMGACVRGRERDFFFRIFCM